MNQKPQKEAAVEFDLPSILCTLLNLIIIRQIATVSQKDFYLLSVKNKTLSPFLLFLLDAFCFLCKCNTINGLITHVFPENVFVYCPGWSDPRFRVEEGISSVLFELKYTTKLQPEHMLFSEVCSFASVFKLGLGWTSSTFWKVRKLLFLHLTAFVPEYSWCVSSSGCNHRVQNAKGLWTG